MNKTINKIPSDIILFNIFPYLDIKDVMIYRTANKKSNNQKTDDYIYKRVLTEHGYPKAYRDNHLLYTFSSPADNTAPQYIDAYIFKKVTGEDIPLKRIKKDNKYIVDCKKRDQLIKKHISIPLMHKVNDLAKILYNKKYVIDGKEYLINRNFGFSKRKKSIQDKELYKTKTYFFYDLSLIQYINKQPPALTACPDEKGTGFKHTLKKFNIPHDLLYYYICLNWD